jgi:hypothetical protein
MALMWNRFSTIAGLPSFVDAKRLFKEEIRGCSLLRVACKRTSPQDFNLKEKTPLRISSGINKSSL